MTKKNKKAPATSRVTARNTQAPKLVLRHVNEAPPATARVEEPIITAAPAIADRVEAPPPAVDRAQIARLAFSKFVARGYLHGLHTADWLEAEAELRAAWR